MEKLAEIDKKYTALVSDLDLAIDKLTLSKVGMFRADCSELILKCEELATSGVYFIEIEVSDEFNNFDDWVKDFISRWEHDDYLKKCTPNTKKKRIEQHSELKRWMPLYIGKSKNIKKRIDGHINQPLNKTTFALKLNARNNLGNPRYRLSKLSVPVKNYDLIVPQIEKRFREKLNPVVGKQ